MKNTHINHDLKIGEVTLSQELDADRINEIGSDTLKMIDKLSQEANEIKILAIFDQSAKFTIDGTASAVKWMNVVSFDCLVMVIGSAPLRAVLQKITDLSGKSECVRFVDSREEGLRLLTKN
ncbi:hypothetical protein KC644_00450 [Candidatus Berkelbacteria bacterium]|nr:hypothetical protein [Candidatus Berkelbacteria bacterium]